MSRAYALTITPLTPARPNCDDSPNDVLRRFEYASFFTEHRERVQYSNGLVITCLNNVPCDAHVHGSCDEPSPFRI